MANIREKLEALPPKLPAIDRELMDLDADARVALLRRENRRLNARLREHEAGLDIVKDAFREAYGEPLEIAVPKSPKASRRQKAEECILHLTDIHFGKKTATYSSTVAAERLVSVCEATAEITELRRKFAVIEKVTLLLGGDMVEGEGAIFPGQAHEIDQDLVSQMIKFGPERIAGLIIFLLDRFRTVSVQAVPGNHGRQAKGSSHRFNADSIFYEVVRLMVSLKSPSTAGRVQWNLPFDRVPGEEWFAHFSIAERWGGVLVHGDQIRGQLGFPWYGYGKKLAGWASCLPSFDYLFAGHFHTHASFDLQDRQCLSTGSTESDNAYAKENMAASGSPKQRLIFCNTRYGLLADHPLYLSDREPRR